MKSYFKCFLLSAFACLLCVGNMQAQADLTEEQKEMFRERVKQKVEEFQSSLSNYVNSSISPELRRDYGLELFSLFMGEGEPYEYHDTESRETIKSTGVKIQTTSTNGSYVRNQLLKKYIEKLYDPQTGKSQLPYNKISIDSASAVRISELNKVGDHYECIAYFCQDFIGWKDGRVWYSDRTAKRIRCYIVRIDLPTGESIFEAKLGDICATETTRIPK